MSEPAVQGGVSEAGGEQRAGPPAMHRPPPNTPARRMALLIYLLSPFLVLALLVWLILVAQRTGPKMNAPPKGAGAGETGMGKGLIDARQKK